MVRILVVYYSAYGRVPELVPVEVARPAGMKVDQSVPLATAEELADYDAIVFGTPTRFGNMAAQMRTFLDQTGALWARGALIGKLGSVFASTASQHGGQETTITSFHHTLMHHGMIVVGLPYPYGGLTRMDEITGSSAYGAATLAGLGGARLAGSLQAMPRGNVKVTVGERLC
jgi:NAD(P)H dehydrogenase (quinone)